MGETTDGQPAGGIRASDAERDATVERLSRAAGDGRLTLEEFSQRMEQATAARRGPNSASSPTSPRNPRSRVPSPRPHPPRPPGTSRRLAACGFPGRGGWPVT